MISCTGLYADVNHNPEQEERTDKIWKNDAIASLINRYKKYKSNYARNIRFDPTMSNFSKFTHTVISNIAIKSPI